MLRLRLFGFILLLTTSYAHAGCWVIGNLHGFGAYEYDQYGFKKDGFSGKVLVINFDENSPSVTDSIMTYTVISPTSMVGAYSTDLGFTMETWQISTDSKKVFMTRSRTNAGFIHDAVSSFVGDVKAKCDH
ncbi:hypothetical protein [Pectobacterium cacticida]|uniref:hypothetical protein n=1 Tax=Pectobacterium cacticida TaxID=69221 RepID=UPI00398870E6